MSKSVTLQVPDELYESMSFAAQRSGQSIEQWVITRIRAVAPTRADRDAALTALLKHAGATNRGDPTAADNERIDEDLAREYGSTHEKEE